MCADYGGGVLSMLDKLYAVPKQKVKFISFPPFFHNPWIARGRNVIAIKPGSDTTVGERSNFKKIPTHTQDHGDA